MSMDANKTGAARRVLGFVKTTAIGGVVFLVPTFILGLLIVKAAGLLRRIAEPFGALLPVKNLFGLLVADILAVGLVVLACFGAGLLARVSFAKQFVKKAESGVLWRIPGYGFVKALTDSVDQSAAASAMRPVLVHFDDYAQLAFEVEQLGDGRKVIYVPSAPDPRAGALLVFEEARVERLPISFVTAISSVRALGRGLSQSLGPATSATRKTAAGVADVRDPGESHGLGRAGLS
jgi:uncharacterized membrane protein